MELKIEVIILPVSDVERSLDFYSNRVGFNVDVDYAPTDTFRVVQLTPEGSAASIQLVSSAEPIGSRETFLLTTDVPAAVATLVEAGVDVEEIKHKRDVDSWQGDFEHGVAPDRRSYSTMAVFRDPDGHRWVLQERGYSS